MELALWIMFCIGFTSGVAATCSFWMGMAARAQSEDARKKGE